MLEQLFPWLSTLFRPQSTSTPMAYVALPSFPIPASIRRRLPRLPRLYLCSHKAGGEIEPGGSLRHGLQSASEPHLPSFTPLAEPIGTEVQRPSTASDDSFDSEPGSITPLIGESYPARYETDSGLRWNRVAPGRKPRMKEQDGCRFNESSAFGLLRNAGLEAQQPQADGRLSRSLYINALMYLLDALPADLTPDETTMLKQRLPETVKASIAPPPPIVQNVTSETTIPKVVSPTRSSLHRLLASTIVQLFLLVRLLLPYIRLLLHRAFEYERSHRITEHIFIATLDAVDSLGKSSADFGTTLCKFNEGRVGVAVGNMATWWVEGIAGGIYEGVGEGMVHLGLSKQGMEVDTLALQIEKR